jgi:glyoxylase-like metal-dependent hydrolase (beta-lactamase superfamily II)
MAQRDTRKLIERFGATLHMPPPDTGDPDPPPGQVFRAGDRLPIGVEIFPGMEPNDLVLWFERQRALVEGVTLFERVSVVEVPPDGAGSTRVPPEQILETLQPLLELPVELVLPTHGVPADRSALQRALS